MQRKSNDESNEHASVPDPSAGHTNREPEDRGINREDEHEVKDKMMDKTLADSYPQRFAVHDSRSQRRRLAG
jgi:hypothetical protein